MPNPKTSLVQLYPKRYDVPLLLLIAFGLLITGLSLPLLTIKQRVLWKHWENRYSVFTGIVGLAQHGDYFLAAVIFFFSIVFPFVKLLALGLIWSVRMSGAQRGSALHWLGILGKWSMLDVFAVAIIVVAAKMRTLTSVEPQIGVYVFGWAIVASMLTTAHVERLASKPVVR